MKALFAVFVSASLAIGCALPEEDIATTEISRSSVESNNDSANDGSSAADDGELRWAKFGMAKFGAAKFGS